MLNECLACRRNARRVIAALSDASLRGLGGAGFPDRAQMVASCAPSPSRA